MLGLTLRKEFQGKRLKGTAIELANEKNTGATQIGGTPRSPIDATRTCLKRPSWRMGTYCTSPTEQTSAASTLSIPSLGHWTLSKPVEDVLAAWRKMKRNT
jgi:hypothetical protein